MLWELLILSPRGGLVNKMHLVLAGFGALYIALAIRSALKNYANLNF